MTTPPTVQDQFGPPAQPAPQQPTSGLAVAGLVLAFLAPLIGLVLSVIALGRTGPGKAKGRGLAVAGAVIGALGTLAGALLLIGIVALGSSADEETVVVDSAAQDAGVEGAAADNDDSDEAAVEEGAAPAEPSVEAGPVDPEVTEFSELTAEDWAALLREPETRAGDGVVFFAEVFQFDTNTGTNAFLANAGYTQPTTEFEFQDTVFVQLSGDAGSQLAEGDVLRVEGVVEGVLDYDTLVGGSNSVPSVTAVSIENVGLADLSGDVTLGDLEAGEYGGAEVEVTITNSGDVEYNYSVDVVAESEDGATQYETTYASADNLAPGQSTTVTASFFDDLPDDATLRIASVDRYDY
ncbi:DUF4190 domain-containing protein [Aquipuribacter nitratireducens]|uniref:DUF4190 domain-containing protein n=1 Tax=Aquipuribacter nitratireducens TaxID=650104 RepID=A0ABW0GHA0_9MICO